MDTIDKINYYLVKNRQNGKQLCEYLGVSSGVYSQWNKKKSRPRQNKLPAIAEFLGVAVEDIMPDEEIQENAGSAAPEEPVTEEDRELSEYLEMLRSRPECRMLFSIAKGATKSDVEKAVVIIEALRKTEGRD